MEINRESLKYAWRATGLAELAVSGVLTYALLDNNPETSNYFKVTFSILDVYLALGGLGHLVRGDNEIQEGIAKKIFLGRALK